MSAAFEVSDPHKSHSVAYVEDRHDYRTDGEPSGQLILCRTGEMQLYGHGGEWIIPTRHMVFIPAERMFRIRTRVRSSGLVMRFCRNEVSWPRAGCWVGRCNQLAIDLAEYSLKWGIGEARKSREARWFYLAVGEMVPGWFQNERIMWTPYAENSIMQKVIDLIRERGPGIALPVAARHAGMSERSLRRHMKRELGQTWREFIREMRMNRAMELLRGQRVSITEVAFEVGFSSSSAFSSAFLDYVGSTPTAFAKSARRNER